MELLYDIIAILVLIFIGYFSEEKREYFLSLLIFLIATGFIIGYFLEDVFIYGILFVLGLVVERMYVSYKWPVTKKPKTADYKPSHDWLMKILTALIMIFTIDIVSDIHIAYSFLAFFGGTLVSWFARKFEK